MRDPEAQAQWDAANEANWNRFLANSTRVIIYRFATSFEDYMEDLVKCFAARKAGHPLDEMYKDVDYRKAYESGHSPNSVSQLYTGKSYPIGSFPKDLKSEVVRVED